MSDIIEQTPNENLPWTIDWSKRGLGGDTILTSNWSVSSDDVTLADGSTNSPTNTTATIWVTGGIPGHTYYITNTIVTVGQITMQESVPYVCIPQRVL